MRSDNAAYQIIGYPAPARRPRPTAFIDDETLPNRNNNSVVLLIQSFLRIDLASFAQAFAAVQRRRATDPGAPVLKGVLLRRVNQWIETDLM